MTVLQRLTNLIHDIVCLAFVVVALRLLFKFTIDLAARCVLKYKIHAVVVEKEAMHRQDVLVLQVAANLDFSL
jgi:hypothetical protein